MPERELLYYLDDLGPASLISMEGWEPRPSHRWDVVDGPVYTRVEAPATPPMFSVTPTDLRSVLAGVTGEFDRVVVPDAGGVQSSAVAFGPDPHGALVAKTGDGSIIRNLSFVWRPDLSDEAHGELVDVVVALGERWPFMFFPDEFQCAASDRQRVEAYVAAWRAGKV